MTRPTRRATGLALAAAAVTALAALSQVPYAPTRASHAVLRLAWRVRGVRVEECRRLTPEELARLPVHMRHAEECTGRVLPYHLTVVRDGEQIVDRVVRAAGAREDRPLYVLEEMPLAAGTHDIAVRFVRDTAEETAGREVLTPVTLALEATLTLGEGEVALVTYDAEQRRLVLRGYGRR